MRKREIFYTVVCHECKRMLLNPPHEQHAMQLRCRPDTAHQLSPCICHPEQHSKQVQTLDLKQSLAVFAWCITSRGVFISRASYSRLPALLHSYKHQALPTGSTWRQDGSTAGTGLARGKAGTGVSGL